MMESKFKDSLKDEFLKEGFNLDESQIEKFFIYKNFLLEYNEKVNLTAITEEREVIVKHFLDSSLLIKYFNLRENASVVDVGSGAGFPSVPIKILRPDIKITMLDGLNKRITFLEKLLLELSISGEPIHIRGEDGGNDERFREVFDIATARAVTRLRELCELTLPLVKVGGYFIALKGDIDFNDNSKDNELLEAKPAIKALGGETAEVENYFLDEDQKRSIIIIKKVKPTPKKYPRSWGRIKKAPIRN